MTVKLWPRSIRQWVIALSLIPLAFLVVVFAAFLRLEHDTEAAASWAQHSDDVLAQFHRLQTDAGDAQNALRRYILTGSGAADKAYWHSVALLPRDASQLKRLVTDNSSQFQIASDLYTYIVRQAKETSQLMDLMHRGNRTAIYQAQLARRLHDPKYGQDSDRIPAEIEQFQTTEQQLSLGRRAETQRLWDTLRLAILFAMAGGVIVAAAIGLTLSRRIVVRLRRLRNQAASFASTGELPEVIKGNDEIGELSRSLHAMAVEVNQRTDGFKRYQLLAALANDAILFLRRADGTILEANHAASELYGYSRDELLQMTCYDLRTPSQDELGGEQMPGDRATSFSVRFESEHRRKDGSRLPVEVSMQSAHLNGEHVVLNLVRDIAPRREAEAAIRAALNQANEASRLKSEFVATMSHEIRTPMNGVIGMTELLLDTELDRDQRELALTARDSAHSLLGVINNILDFSKIEAGKLESEITEFDLIAKIESVAAMLGSQAHKKSVSLMTYVDPLIPRRLLGDPLRLRQVLVNLVGNAVKFTDHGGVAVIVDPVVLEDEIVRLRFAVRDTGIGIPADTLPKLFTAFTQADGSTTRRFGGTGLGLAISKRLVELLGGELRVESEAGHGSTFEFQLNFHVADPGRDSCKRELRDLHVIIVDDDVTSRDIFSRYANSWGLRTAVAETAQAALAMMLQAAQKGEPYDLALIDLRMPQIDGMELARRVRGEPAIAGTKLLLATAFDAPQQGREAIAAGFTAYLTKPVRQSQLFEAIDESVLGTYRQFEAFEQSVQVASPHDEPILLVEDNEVNRQVFMRQLQRLGYQAQCAIDGRDALERVAREDYELIFMDCHMPVMDGFQATRAIRKMENATGKHATIIALTANALAGDREECLAAGMDDYLAKPVALNELARTIDKWIPVASL